MSFNGKVALVTGANKGIGFETVRQLARLGFTTLLGARDEARGKEAEAKLKDEDLDVRYLRLDVGDPATHENCAKVYRRKFRQTRCARQQCRSQSRRHETRTGEPDFARCLPQDV